MNKEKYIEKYFARQDNLKMKLLTYKQIELHKAKKRAFKHALPSYWKTTTTKKVVWISVILTIALWIVAIILNILMSPLILGLPETAVSMFTESCKDVTLGLFATIVFYLLRAFLDSWNIARTGLDVSENNYPDDNTFNLSDDITKGVHNHE